MSVQVRSAEGDAGEAVAFDGKLLSLVLPRAQAPGRPLQLSILLEEPLALSGRSIGSRRREDGRFDVRMRLVNLTRGAREALLAALRG